MHEATIDLVDVPVVASRRRRLAERRPHAVAGVRVEAIEQVLGLWVGGEVVFCLDVERDGPESVLLEEEPDSIGMEADVVGVRLWNVWVTAESDCASNTARTSASSSGRPSTARYGVNAPAIAVMSSASTLLIVRLVTAVEDATNASILRAGGHQRDHLDASALLVEPDVLIAVAIQIHDLTRSRSRAGRRYRTPRPARPGTR